MNSEVEPGGKSPGASGAHDAAVFGGYMTIHVSYIGKNSPAIGAAVSSSGVMVQIGFRGEGGQALGAVSVGADHKQAGGVIRKNLGLVAGQM